MTRAAQAQARAEELFQQYLGMGSERSLRKLAAELRHSCGENPPSLRTLENWSARYGWERRAKQFDYEEAERAKRELLARRANVQVERCEIALDHSWVLHHYFREVMTRVESRTQVGDNGSIIRQWEERVPIPPDEIPKADLFAAMAAERQATMIEERLVGTARKEHETYLEQMGRDGPQIQVLGKEAITEMGIKVGTLVREIAKNTEEKRALRELQMAQEE